MRENIEGFARPVRTVLRSSRVTATAFSIFSSASKRVSSITAAPVLLDAQAVLALGGADQCADPLTPYRATDVALGQQVEHDDRHIVVHAQAECRRIRDLEAALQHLAMCDLGEHLGGGVGLGVGGV